MLYAQGHTTSRWQGGIQKPSVWFQVFSFIRQRNCWEHRSACEYVRVKGVFWVLPSCPAKKVLLTKWWADPPAPRYVCLCSCFLWRWAALGFHLVIILTSSLLGREGMGKDNAVQLRFSYRLPEEVIICSLQMCSAKATVHSNVMKYCYMPVV